MSDETKVIGKCSYNFRKANFMEARTEAFKLTALLKGCFKAVKDVDGKEKSDFDIGQLLSNLNSKEMADVELFISKNATVTDENGEKFLLMNQAEANKFFNDHRDEYFQFLFEGLKFHFLGFLPSGIASKVNTLNLDSLAALAM